MQKCLKINRLENEVKKHVQTRAQLDSFMHNLGVSDRDRTIMHMRLGLENEEKMTLREIAQKMERSAELIRKRKDKTCQKLLAHIKLRTEIANLVRDPTRLLDASVQILDLSWRARNVMAIANVKTMGELLQKTPEFIFNYKRCGVKTLEEIRSKLATMKLTLRNGG